MLATCGQKYVVVEGLAQFFYKFWTRSKCGNIFQNGGKVKEKFVFFYSKLQKIIAQKFSTDEKFALHLKLRQLYALSESEEMKFLCRKLAKLWTFEKDPVIWQGFTKIALIS